MSHEMQLLQKEVAQLRVKVQEMETELRIVTKALPIEIFPGQWMPVSQIDSMRQQLEHDIESGCTLPAARVIEYLEKKESSEAMSLETLFAK